MSLEVVAVRWACFACEATAITAPGDPPADWFEKPAPPWRSSHPPRHYCPDHAAEGRDLNRRQRARFEDRTHVVSVAEFEAVKSALKAATHRLNQMKFSGQRAGDLKE